MTDKKVGSYGEPWRLDAPGGIAVAQDINKSDALQLGNSLDSLVRAIHCVNAMQGIENPKAFIEAVEAIENQYQYSHEPGCLADGICICVNQIFLSKLQSARGVKP